MVLACGVLVPACAAQPPSPAQRDELRARIRATLFVPEQAPALASSGHGSFQPAPGVIAERVSYSTLLGLRVPAILYLPEAHIGKAPALIVVNGHGGDKYSWYAYCAGGNAPL
jgi:hypothetical protein